jgi:hypothetical protein
MRKLLLATAAMLGATVGATGLAVAAPAFTNQGTVATPANMGSFTYGDNNYMSGTPTKGSVANPTPGTMVIRLGLMMQVGIGAAWSNLDTGTSAAGVTQKLSPVLIQEYMRIYPGVDAMAANGLRYGAAVELRQNYASAAGAEPLTNGGTVYTSTQTVFVRRAFGYVGGNWGIIRLGEMDGLIGTYDEGGATTGVYLSPTGTIVGGNDQALNVGNAWMIPYFAAQSGNEYGNAKIVYLSPSFYGFDFGAEYAPNPFNGYAIGGGYLPGATGIAALGTCYSAAGSGCPNVSSSSVPLSGSISQNEYSVGVRYQGKLGPAAVLAYGLYVGSGHTNYTGTAAAAFAASGAPHGSTYNGKFQDLSLGMFGANVNVAGFAVFGNVMFGKFNGILGLTPDGAPNATGFGVGFKYVTGPYSIGAVYSQFDSQGAYNLVGISQRHEWVFAAAATYYAAPGLIFSLDYDYGQRYQGGYNFMTGAVGSAAYNHVQAQGVLAQFMVKY